MREGIDRVEQELNKWKQQEQQVVQLFSPAVIKSKDFQKEKLRRMDSIYSSYKNGATREEKLTLRALLIARKQLAKQLYPSVVSRLFRLIISGTSNTIEKKQLKDRSEKNTEQLSSVIMEAGFGDQKNKLLSQIRKGENEFSIPVSYFSGEKHRLDCELNFSKTQHGNYQFDSYKASLKSDDNKAVSKQQQFSMEAGTIIAVEQAKNLLEGRFVLAGANWVRIDFNDKDTGGNHKIRTFPPDHHYDLKKVVQGLPFKEIDSPSVKSKLLEALRNGYMEPVTLAIEGKEQKLFIEANPQLKSINVYDTALNKISLSEMLHPKPVQPVIQLSQKHDHQLSRKNGMSI